MEFITLASVLAWVASGGGAILVANWLLERVRFLVELQAEARRIVAFALTGSIAAGFYALSVWAKYNPLPVGFQGWLEALFPIAATAVGLGQLIHGRTKLRQKPPVVVDSERFFV
jgi:hypothetical protein